MINGVQPNCDSPGPLQSVGRLRQLTVLLLLTAFPVHSADVSAEPEASLIPDGRLVMAHYMTKLVPCAEGEYSWVSPRLYRPDGPARSCGGLYLTLPMWTVLQPGMTLDEACDFEIRTAQHMGVNGFQFFYPLVRSAQKLQPYNRIIRRFIRTAEQHYPDFRVSLCLSGASRYADRTEDENVEIWGSAIRDLLADTRDSPVWLKTRSGNFLFYEWVSDGLADDVKHRANRPEQVTSVARAFRRVAERAEADIDWVYQVRRTVADDAYLQTILNEFPAVWGWVDGDEQPDFWDDLARRCAESGVAWTQTVYPDYFTSKTYRPDEQPPRILPWEDAMVSNAAKLERHYRQTDLARGQVQLLRKAISRNAAVINYVTWNDWPEGHHLAPEVNHNFGPSLLLRHFAAEWRGEESPLQDVAILFYKKYPSEAEPRHAVSLHVKSQRNQPREEDVVQLVTILQRPARCVLNGKSPQQLPAGFHISEWPLPVRGRLRAKLWRDKAERPFIVLRPEIPVTQKPWRTDRLTCSQSSLFAEELQAVFGSQVVPVRAVHPHEARWKNRFQSVLAVHTEKRADSAAGSRSSRINPVKE